MGSFQYTITRAPKALREAKLDNIALVPASLLPLKATYQPLANTFPTGSVLCVPGTPRQQEIIAKVTQFFRDHGHTVITMPLENITRTMKQTLRLHAESLRLAL